MGIKCKTFAARFIYSSKKIKTTERITFNTQHVYPVIVHIQIVCYCLGPSIIVILWQLLLCCQVFYSMVSYHILRIIAFPIHIFAANFH